jgi:hypothetical protein
MTRCCAYQWVRRDPRGSAIRDRTRWNGSPMPQHLEKVSRFSHHQSSLKSNYESKYHRIIIMNYQFQPIFTYDLNTRKSFNSYRHSTSKLCRYFKKLPISEGILGFFCEPSRPFINSQITIANSWCGTLFWAWDNERYKLMIEDIGCRGAKLAFRNWSSKTWIILRLFTYILLKHQLPHNIASICSFTPETRVPTLLLQWTE